MDLQSSIERISPVECRVKVEIPWSEVSGRLDTKLRDLRRRARLPGFRPGKVPPQVIERMFGKSVRQELASDLVQETFPTVITNHEATPLTQPVLESSSLESGEPFTYAARFEVPPAIAPKDYVEVPVRRRPPVVDRAKIDAELERRREQLTELRPLPDEPGRTHTQPGDVWTVDVEGTVGDQRVSKKDLNVDIGDTSEKEFVPGLAEALGGLALTEVGTGKTITFELPSARVRPELRGRSATLTLGLRDVRIKHRPELDDDFARDTEEAETLAELEEKIAKDLETSDREQAEQEARRRLLDTLLERNPFEPPPSLIAREVTAQVDQTKRQLAQQGLRLSALGTDERQLARNIRPQAVYGVKAALLLEAIAKAESITVSDEELEAELVRTAEATGQNLARMRATMEKNNQLVLVRARLQEQKVFEFLMARAVITEAPDPPEDAESGDDAPG